MYSSEMPQFDQEKLAGLLTEFFSSQNIPPEDFAGIEIEVRFNPQLLEGKSSESPQQRSVVQQPVSLIRMSCKPGGPPYSPCPTGFHLVG
jgi:hypothetical protein